MDTFEILVLSSISLLTTSMLVFFYLMITKLKRELSRMQQNLWKLTEERGPPNCIHHLGFLSSYPRDKSLPDECLGCPEVISCFEIARKVQIDAKAQNAHKQVVS